MTGEGLTIIFTEKYGSLSCILTYLLMYSLKLFTGAMILNTFWEDQALYRQCKSIRLPDFWVHNSFLITVLQNNALNGSSQESFFCLND